MIVQVLVATMNQSKGDYSLLDRMNIQTDAIICNQCSRNEFEAFTWHGHNIRWLSFTEKGVGLNRNNALMRATGDVILFADDDMVYVDGYESIITEAFENNPNADAFIFNIETIGNSMGRKQNSKVRRLHFYNSLNYGTARISALSDSIRRENISFHMCFGGGTMYSCGEDTLFIVDMLKKGLKIYSCPIKLAEVDQRQSTWFTGYNEKYLFDKGALFAAISKKWNSLLCFQDLLRHPYLYRGNNIGLFGAYRIMKQGIRAFGELKSYTK